MNRSIASVSLILGLFLGSSAHAGLMGEQVAGSLRFNGGSTNYFAPANTFVPAGFLNVAGATVTIADPAQEFGYMDRANRDVADFTDSQLVITDEVFSNAGSWVMTFTSLGSGLFKSLSLVEQSFDPALTYSLLNDTITVNWSGKDSPANFHAVFNVDTVNRIPEPASLALLGLGFTGLLASSRRRKTA